LFLGDQSGCPLLSASRQNRTSLTATVPDIMRSGSAEVRVKMPAGARLDAVFDRVRAEAPGRAVELALSLVADTEAGRAAG
jgi:hypothetical protein